MCGIAGIVSWSSKHHITREVLAPMSACIAHRGPDGQGFWINPEGEPSTDRPQAGLVHRRLAILDLDPRANQPFTDGRGNWIVFNGEIYNFRMLRERLSALCPDYRWKTQCDTEVLLVAYAAWGKRCVEELNGMFAFAIWDEARGSLFLARDRMGQKPLYVAYLQRDGQWANDLAEGDTVGPPAVIAFASELPALAALPWVDRKIDEQSLVQYLRWGFIPAPATTWKSCFKMLPGMSATITSAGATSERYFASEAEPSRKISDVDAREQTRSGIETAVQRQLVSDVPLGCFLSGGIDSSIIAASMTRALPEGSVHTFSIGFEDPAYDETQAAEGVARHLGTRHLSFQVKPDAAADLPKLAAVYGEPFGDSSALPTHYLSREVRQHLKVALSGDGGDELFGGYDRYRALILSERLRKVPRGVRGAVSKMLPGLHPKGALPRLRRLLATVDEPIARRYASYLRLFSDEAINKLLPANSAMLSNLTKSPDELEARMDLLLGHRAPVVAAAAADRGFYLPDDLLTKLDRASMLHALEVRSPFMDHELVQLASRLSTEQLILGGPKRMLREAFAGDLPAWVFRRKKMGFAVPIGQWFRGELRPMLREHLLASDAFAATHFNRDAIEQMIDEHEQKRVDHSQRLYALLMLELWWKTARLT